MSDAARLLAEIHAARALMRTATPVAARPAIAALWAHAMRAPGAPVDLTVVRALRDDPEAARRYRTLLAAQSAAHAPFAAAASDGSLHTRRVGSFVLAIVPAEDEALPLLVIRGGDEVPLRLIEVMWGEETARLALPLAVDGAWVLALDPRIPEADRLGRLLREPGSAVFLL